MEHNLSIIVATATIHIVWLRPGPEPTVRPVRFWPDHFLLGARPLLVNAWGWHLQ